MSKNAREIDYRLRIAKSVERRMLCTAFQKLSAFYSLDSYKYIGFGAFYFSDFYLFHKELGINDMLSLEKANTPEIKKRYNFNKPFNCIKIDFRESNQVLPGLEWQKPVIIWLDYTDALNSEILSDIDTVIRNAKAGSAIIITLNAESQIYDNNDNHPSNFNRLDVFREVIGASRVPRGVKVNQISNKEIVNLYREILIEEIKKLLYERNSGNTETNLNFQQLFNFKYKDGISMYSFGGILIDKCKHGELMQTIGIDKLPFIKTGKDVFNLQVPNLTLKEIKFLESIMPGGIDENGNILDLSNLYHEDPKIPTQDVLSFSKIYQYFPTFAESRIG